MLNEENESHSGGCLEIAGGEGWEGGRMKGHKKLWGVDRFTTE